MDYELVELPRLNPALETQTKNLLLLGFSMPTLYPCIRGSDPPLYRDKFFDEVWGLNELYLFIDRYHRWFEMHKLEHVEETWRASNHGKWLRQCPVPLYMLEKHPEIPNSIKFPAREMVLKFGSEWFSSSLAYMLALAIYEKIFKEIHIYGVDLATKEEYIIQRPGFMHLVWVARAEGTTIYFPSECALLHPMPLYGFDKELD